jgi:uncharacterized phage infection (PIP) family protein YhgE
VVFDEKLFPAQHKNSNLGLQQKSLSATQSSIITSKLLSDFNFSPTQLVAPTFIPSSPTNVHDFTTIENSPSVPSVPTSTPIQPVSPLATSPKPSQPEFASLQSVPSVPFPALDDLSTSYTTIQHVSPPIEPSHQMIT